MKNIADIPDKIRFRILPTNSRSLREQAQKTIGYHLDISGGRFSLILQIHWNLFTQAALYRLYRFFNYLYL